MYFDPKTDKFPYPENTDEHYLKIKKNNGLDFNSDYPYFDKSKDFRFKQSLIRFLLVLIVFPISRIYIGLKIKGKKNVKRNKELLKNGAISVCNHVHLWDYIGIMKGIKPFKPYVLVWAPNIRGENAFLIRMVGGVPVPDNDMKATFVYMDAVGEHLKNHGWLHIFPEGSMWEYYAPIRPFKKGAAYFSCRYDKPILPMAFSYRKPSWIRKHIFKQDACFTLTIGEPLYPNKELSINEQEIDLIKRSHDAVCKLANIDPKENIYEPIFNKDKRVDYYTNQYGNGYKS